MLFQTYTYFALFLPVTIVVYFFLNSKRLTIASRSWLVMSSLFFYSWWDISFLPLILFSILFNYTVGTVLGKEHSYGRPVLMAGIITNLGLLGFFKYTNFFIETINSFTSSGFGAFDIILPLAISFFTFQQITYLVDSYKGETREYNFLNYTLFVAFFPQLIAGPIVHHKAMMSQFQRLRNKVPNYRNLSIGISIFVLGLFKKVVIADSLSPYVSQAFDSVQGLSIMHSWIASLSYTFQIYFDFSGYMDMAIGSALMLNIKLPINFNSPYMSLSVREFWRRWHITLGRFLMENVYIPLGGSRQGDFRLYLSLMTTFLLGGLWHGAGWTFIFWGALHGAAVVTNRLWEKTGLTLNKFVAWFITFNYINITWVFFRAESWGNAIGVLKGMFGLSELSLRTAMKDKIDFFELLPFSFLNDFNEIYIFLFLLLLAVTLLKNSVKRIEDFSPTLTNFIFIMVLGLLSFIGLDTVSEFLYFNF